MPDLPDAQGLVSKVPHMFGTSIGSAVVWRWDRAHMRFAAEHREHWVVVQFHKLGGRWSKTLPDGAPNDDSSKSYWTIGVDGERSSKKHATSADAKGAAVAEFARRFGVVE